MGRAAKIAVIAVLGGLIMALAILHASSPPAPASAPTMTEAGAPVTDTAIAERCRSITVADSECEAAWEAKRRHFFGQKD